MPYFIIINHLTPEHQASKNDLNELKKASKRFLE